ncbi:hemolysin family protein [Pseudoflavitalea rhizosphaerae]|uniref:hemolysin family protein n=1 Tax=Pseudoflavitalea rhizosphaerae TaxID=1884793 RepID=UPI000F8CC301|nr:hemolysin family protein [Pseudoflavitalea rhizosphaerae]
MSLIVILVICFAILAIAYFSGIEVAFTSASRLNVELKRTQGASGIAFLSSLYDNPSRFIGTNIVGFNLWLVIAVLSGSAGWSLMIDSFQLSKDFVDSFAWLRVIIEILLSWLVVIIFCEFIPKAIFRAKADSALSFSARSGLLAFSDGLFHWVADAFSRLSIFILNVIFDMRIDKKKETFSRSDLEHFAQQSSDQHSMEHQDLKTELFRNAVSLPKVKIRDCLVPRKEIVAVDLNTPMEQVRAQFIDTKLSKLVVYEGNIDTIVGYIHQLDLFKNPSTVKQILLPIPAIPESMSVTDLINKFTRERKSIAWVVDEFGGTAGIVTMEDLLEEIFGDIRDEYDTEEFEEKKISDDEYILSGRLELDHLREKYGLQFPENDSETLSGFIIHQHETIPRLKERIIIGHYEFEVLNVSDTRIEMVRLKILKI